MVNCIDNSIVSNDLDNGISNSICNGLAYAKQRKGQLRMSWLSQIYIQEKINYAKLFEFYKLRVRILEKSEAQLLRVSIPDKSTKGVVFHLTLLLAMFPGEVTMVKMLPISTDPLTKINKSLS